MGPAPAPFFDADHDRQMSLLDQELEAELAACSSYKQLHTHFPYCSPMRSTGNSAASTPHQQHWTSSLGFYEEDEDEDEPSPVLPLALKAKSPNRPTTAPECDLTAKAPLPALRSGSLVAVDVDDRWHNACEEEDDMAEDDHYEDDFEPTHYDAWIGPSPGIPAIPIHAAAIESVKKNFPGAMPDGQIVSYLMRCLETKIPGFNPKDCLLGTSFCPDEISNEKGDLPFLLHERFGKVFQFSGLGGIPFAGKTGFKAFAAHIPDNGNVLIVYGPHVAIAPDGTVGKFKRAGQKHLTTACGACIGALASVEAGKKLASANTIEYEQDFQMNYITEKMKERLPAILAHPNGKQVGLPFESFGIAQQLMHNIIDVDCLNGGMCILLGGIQINMPDPLPDFYLPLCFKKHQAGQAPEPWGNLLSDHSLFQ